MFWINNRSYRGPVLPLTEGEHALCKNLSDHVYMLAGDIGARSLTSAPENLEKAAQYIEHVFKRQGYTHRREEFDCTVASAKNISVSGGDIKFPLVKYTTCNVIAEAIGQTEQAEIIIVGAHYDSVYDCPAANDNGSGVAAMLELARLFQGKKLKRTLRFVAFTNEEPPFFRTDEMGSYRHAIACKGRNEKIAAMFSLETMGFFSDLAGSQKYPHPTFKLFMPDAGNFISFISNTSSASLLNRCVKSFRRTKKFPYQSIALPASIPGVDYSDQYYFWKLGYPAIMITDTAFYRYPHYHESEDTPDKVNYEHLARIVSGLETVMTDLAGS